MREEESHGHPMHIVLFLVHREEWLRCSRSVAPPAHREISLCFIDRPSEPTPTGLHGGKEKNISGIVSLPLNQLVTL